MPRLERWAARRICAPSRSTSDSRHCRWKRRSIALRRRPCTPDRRSRNRPTRNVQDFRKSLEALKVLKTDKLSMLMRGTLDLSSHRLDAWVTSFATKRLKTMRQKDPAGVYLGGYGWVEDLQPGPPRTEVTPPPGEPGPVFGFRNDPGFVHAPSLDHAATVAVLRSGHLTRFGRTPDPQADPLAIDLSSERARTAQYLLDGVRSGQPLAALLGYRFERALHERGLDVFIDAFRHIVPIKSARVDETGQAVEVCAGDPCRGWARPRAPNERAGGSRDSSSVRERVSASCRCRPS